MLLVTVHVYCIIQACVMEHPLQGQGKAYVEVIQVRQLNARLSSNAFKALRVTYAAISQYARAEVLSAELRVAAAARYVAFALCILFEV